MCWWFVSVNKCANRTKDILNYKSSTWTNERNTNITYGLMTRNSTSLCLSIFLSSISLPFHSRLILFLSFSVFHLSLCFTFLFHLSFLAFFIFISFFLSLLEREWFLFLFYTFSIQICSFLSFDFPSSCNDTSIFHFFQHELRWFLHEFSRLLCFFFSICKTVTCHNNIWNDRFKLKPSTKIPIQF